MLVLDEDEFEGARQSPVEQRGRNSNTSINFGWWRRWRWQVEQGGKIWQDVGDCVSPEPFLSMVVPLPSFNCSVLLFSFLLFSASAVSHSTFTKTSSFWMHQNKFVLDALEQVRMHQNNMQFVLCIMCLICDRSGEGQFGDAHQYRFRSLL